MMWVRKGSLVLMILGSSHINILFPFQKRVPRDFIFSNRPDYFIPSGGALRELSGLSPTICERLLPWKI